jgi:hypothetical protein
VEVYSQVFRDVLRKYPCHVLVYGMNLKTDDSNRERTDNKYADFGLDLPPERVTYMKGKSWPLELEIASRSTVCCGNPSGFTEGLWLKRGRGVVLMHSPPHYLAKAAYHRMPLFRLNRPLNLAAAFFRHSASYYEKRLSSFLS